MICISVASEYVSSSFDMICNAIQLSIHQSITDYGFTNFQMIFDIELKEREQKRKKKEHEIRLKFERFQKDKNVHMTSNYVPNLPLQ